MLSGHGERRHGAFLPIQECDFPPAVPGLHSTFAGSLTREMESRDLSTPGSHKPGNLSQDLNRQGGMDPDEAWDKRQLCRHSKEGRKDLNLEGASSSQEKALDLVKEETGILECQKTKFAGFLRVFPTNKDKIEKYIKSLHEIADNTDKVHQGCTVAKITGNSIGILGELSTIASNLLASCSASWSLGMGIAANGAKLVGTATDVAANLTDNVHQLKKREEGEKLMEEAKANLEELDLDLDLVFAPTALNVCDNIQVISDITKSAMALNKYVEGLACVQADPALKDLALKIAAKGEETEDLKKVKKALAGTPFAMTKEERQEKYLLSIEILMRRINTLALDSLSMVNRTEVPVASVMRKKAGELKQILEKLEKIYESLRKESMTEEQF